MKKEREKWSQGLEGKQVVQLQPDGAGSDGQIGGMSPVEQTGKSNKDEELESETSKRIRAELAAITNERRNEFLCVALLPEAILAARRTSESSAAFKLVSAGTPVGPAAT